MLENYLIIHKSILPDYFEKVLQVRRLMESGKIREVSQAVKQVGISRSTYYKYKDYVFAPSDMEGGRKAVLDMMLDHTPGVLSALLSRISAVDASVVTISQSPPINGRASVTVTLDISAMSVNMQELLELISSTAGVENPKLLAME
ncbi:MAG: ACT domain-containing protein [Oscillospiraceae bacterium]|nr:ACT domain-containing protein [Oscillospiraceae bacterium]